MSSAAVLVIKRQTFFGTRLSGIMRNDANQPWPILPINDRRWIAGDPRGQLRVIGLLATGLDQAPQR